MCGFTGFVSRSTAPDEKALRAMGDSIRHRGPDGEGHYIDKHCVCHRLQWRDLQLQAPAGGADLCWPHLSHQL